MIAEDPYELIKASLTSQTFYNLILYNSDTVYNFCLTHITLEINFIGCLKKFWSL